MKKPFTVTACYDDATVTIIQGADYITLKVAEVEDLVSALRTAAWMTGNPALKTALAQGGSRENE